MTPARHAFGLYRPPSPPLRPRRRAGRAPSAGALSARPTARGRPRVARGSLPPSPRRSVPAGWVFGHTTHHAARERIRTRAWRTHGTALRSAMCRQRLRPAPRPQAAHRSQPQARHGSISRLACGVCVRIRSALSRERALRPSAGVQSMLRAPSAAQPFSDSSEAPSLPRPSTRLGARCLPLHTSFCTATSATAALRMAIPSLPSFPPRRRILSGLPLATVEL